MLGRLWARGFLMLLSHLVRPAIPRLTPLARSFASSTAIRMQVLPVLVSADNYAYLLIDEASRKAAVIDPYDVPKVQAVAQEAGVEIVANLTTHHHMDHAGGNKDFASAYPGVPIYGGSQQVKAVNKIAQDKEEFTVGDTIRVKCLATPCHTRDSICYYATSSSSSHPGAVFTGDTLFIAGCGRFFEGNGTDMHAALSSLEKLPPQTIVYNGHEYTKGSLAFAKSVDPENPALKRLEKIVSENEVTTGRTTLGDEKEWNPFMRLTTEPIKKATFEQTESAIMGALRDMKNSFRG
ncbi:Metallo-hydrolase/oxidoreductase [Laetiporus sulphureus 93-53]|uniref:hydroxyacylglutathione hydrolase n=1 Tax=Laetiporus sulphureus 93-53 TaxID=1314785 RepID=A0A165H9H7_9APHY|nr:Metallo-hydrolase/oxidoreductase [Laetiporus sulphureus 93-53]KZT11428.1 Metallo-hydrolase/oxidoreductase [Laetiporus sulphureus 93-53]